MKKTIALLSVLVLAGVVSQAFADGSYTNSPPPTYTNSPPTYTNSPPTYTNSPPTYTNSPPTYTNSPPTYTNTYPHPIWSTNTPPPPPPHWTNSPPPNWTNNHPRVLPPPGAHHPPGIGEKPPLPADVQATIQQFQTDRTALLSQLKTATEEQRKVILQQLADLRAQLQTELAKLRDQAKDQAEQMKGRFGNSRDRILNQGGGNRNSGPGAGAGGGRDR